MSVSLQLIRADILFPVFSLSLRLYLSPSLPLSPYLQRQRKTYVFPFIHSPIYPSIPLTQLLFAICKYQYNQSPRLLLLLINVTVIVFPTKHLYLPQVHPPRGVRIIVQTATRMRSKLFQQYTNYVLCQLCFFLVSQSNHYAISSFCCLNLLFTFLNRLNFGHDVAIIE